ncbi:MAG: glycosyltransferase family 9 protein [Planctomycetota bacterium]|nr:glycosyltransferase family 9 protein [Planctomycetota bacterium]
MWKRISPDRLRQLEPRRICLIKPSAFGDVAQVLPVLSALRERFPHTDISWVIQAGLSDLINGHPALTDWIPFHRHGGVSGWLTLLKTIRSRRFDLVLDLQGLLRSAAMCLASGAAIRVGLETAREGSHLSCHVLVPGTGREVPAHERYWRVAQAFGVNTPKPNAIVPLTSDDNAWAIRETDSLPRPIVGIHAGARWETKRWPAEKFEEVARRVINTWRGSVVLLGSPDEKPVSQQIQDQLGNSDRVRNLTGHSTLKQLAAMLSQIDMLISNDSGPMHLADALQTPVVGIFTCTDATRSGPASPIHELVSTQVECRAGYHKRCPMTGSRHLACFAELEIERVWAACERIRMARRIAAA